MHHCRPGPAAVCVILALGAAEPAAAQPVCGAAVVGAAQVSAVTDGRTLLLTDGRELRLAAIEVTEASRAALEKLVRGQPLTIRTAAAATDRYGRVVAFVHLPGATESVQQTLLGEGLARVSARVDDAACAQVLLKAELDARTAGRGHWPDPNFAPLQAENPAGIAAKRGHFALVEGKVLSVRESGATIYVNFGRRWTRDFTVMILKRTERTFASAGVQPKRLEGRRIRVRGWVEQRGGPAIAALAPGQIEILD